MDLQQHHVVDHKSHLLSAITESCPSRWETDIVSWRHGLKREKQQLLLAKAWRMKVDFMTVILMNA